MSGGKTVTSTKVTGTKYKFVVVPTTDFTVYVTAYNSKGRSTVSDHVNVTVSPTVLGIPKAVTADNEGNVSWTAAKNASYYKVSRVSKGKTVTSNKVTDTKYKFVLVPTSDFSVYVTAFDASGNSVMSEKVEVSADKAVHPVTQIKVDKAGNIKWEAAQNAVAYKIARKVGKSTTFSKKITETSYKFTSAPTEVYTLYITSYDKDDNSVKSETFTIDPSKLLGAPTNVTVSNNGTVKWTAADNAVSYKVSRVSDGKTTTSRFVTSTSYKFVAVPTVSYNVYVTAYDAEGNSVSSAIVTVK